VPDAKTERLTRTAVAERALRLGDEEGVEAITIRRLASLMAELAGTPDTPTFRPVRAGDVRHSLADVSRARAALGYEPSPSIASALKATIDWCRATGMSPASAKPSTP